MEPTDTTIADDEIQTVFAGQSPAATISADTDTADQSDSDGTDRQDADDTDSTDPKTDQTVQDSDGTDRATPSSPWKSCRTVLTGITACSSRRIASTIRALDSPMA